MFQYSFSKVVPIFFNLLKSDFFPCPIAIKFLPVVGVNWIEICENVVLSKIDITMATINRQNGN